jgi:hypothetical protein
MKDSWLVQGMLSVPTSDRIALFRIAAGRDCDAATALLGEAPGDMTAADLYAMHVFLDDRAAKGASRTSPGNSLRLDSETASLAVWAERSHASSASCTGPAATRDRHRQSDRRTAPERPRNPPLQGCRPHEYLSKTKTRRTGVAV